MTDSLESILGKTTYNAEQWANTIEDAAVNRPTSYEDRRGKAVEKALPQIMEILRSNLSDAISQSAGAYGEGEFDTAKLRVPLEQAFNNNEIVQIMDDQVDLIEGALEFAGSWQDWGDGIEAARRELHLGGGNRTPEQRAIFWRDFIYGPARMGMDPALYADEANAEKVALRAKEMYESTMDARLTAWEQTGGAPYWLILEHGNSESDLAFPKFKGTGFLENTRKSAQRIYDQELYDVFNQEENLVLTAVGEFVNDPANYKPYDPLAQFYAGGKKYQVYVTKTRRIGVALRVRRGR